mmetsp:Transcript_68950/g.218044  ORF Transcript_68950/g.218044 Transcript_68950/m.218044 type:complete len:310 (+) Transcript_68950:634-1563(+)
MHVKDLLAHPAAVVLGAHPRERGRAGEGEQDGAVGLLPARPAPRGAAGHGPALRQQRPPRGAPLPGRAPALPAHATRPLPTAPGREPDEGPAPLLGGGRALGLSRNGAHFRPWALLRPRRLLLLRPPQEIPRPPPSPGPPPRPLPQSSRRGQLPPLLRSHPVGGELAEAGHGRPPAREVLGGHDDVLPRHMARGCVLEDQVGVPDAPVSDPRRVAELVDDVAWGPALREPIRHELAGPPVPAVGKEVILPVKPVPVRPCSPDVAEHIRPYFGEGAGVPRDEEVIRHRGVRHPVLAAGEPLEYAHHERPI